MVNVNAIMICMFPRSIIAPRQLADSLALFPWPPPCGGCAQKMGEAVAIAAPLGYVITPSMLLGTYKKRGAGGAGKRISTRLSPKGIQNVFSLQIASANLLKILSRLRCDQYAGIKHFYRREKGTSALIV